MTLSKALEISKNTTRDEQPLSLATRSQMFLVLCRYLFSENVSVFENLRKALESFSPSWLPMTHSIPVQSQILSDQTENRQLTVCCPVNRWKL